MKVGITCGGIGPFASGDYIRQTASAAERAGFAHYWLPEHVVQFAVYPDSTYPYAGGAGQVVPDQDPDAPLQFADETNPFTDPCAPIVDPLIGMTWAAAATTKIEVGSNILILPQRNPVLLAKALATLDSFSSGRVVLGVGVGWAKEESVAVGADFASRGRRTDEAIQIMRELWSSEKSSFDGDDYSFSDAYSFPKPTRLGGVPILIGGESKAAMKRIARFGDGWLPYKLSLEEAPGVIAAVKEMTAANGRNAEALRIIKILYSNTPLDEFKRFRDAGVTEFNIASNGEIPIDVKGMTYKLKQFQESIVGPVNEL